MKIKKFNESGTSVLDHMKTLKDGGWYWVSLGHENVPCWFSLDSQDIESSYFLPGGMGDSSSMGIEHYDIEKIGPEIIEPQF